MMALIDYESYYLTWYDSSCGDAGLYGEPLSSSQDESYDDSYYLTYEEVDDYSSRSWYVNGETNQDYRGMETPYSGSGTWLGDYTSYFGSYWGENEVSSDEGYGAYGSSLEKQDSSLYEGDGSYYSYNNNMQLDYSENQWDDYGGLGFGGGSMDDSLENRDLPYNSSWDEWEETTLYERIFGH